MKQFIWHETDVPSVSVIKITKWHYTEHTDCILSFEITLFIFTWWSGRTQESSDKNSLVISVIWQPHHLNTQWVPGRQIRANSPGSSWKLLVQTSTRFMIRCYTPWTFSATYITRAKYIFCVTHIASISQVFSAINVASVTHVVSPTFFGRHPLGSHCMILCPPLTSHGG